MIRMRFHAGIENRLCLSVQKDFCTERTIKGEYILWDIRREVVDLLVAFMRSREYRIVLFLAEFLS